MSSPTDAVTVECRAGADVGTISKAGIKYISSADGDVGEAKGVEDSISGNAFYGNINKIPDVKSGKYYAKAYVESEGGTVWSQLMAARSIGLRYSPHTREVKTNESICDTRNRNDGF